MATAETAMGGGFRRNTVFKLKLKKQLNKNHRCHDVIFTIRTVYSPFTVVVGMVGTVAAYENEAGFP